MLLWFRIPYIPFWRYISYMLTATYRFTVMHTFQNNIFSPLALAVFKDNKQKTLMWNVWSSQLVNLIKWLRIYYAMLLRNSMIFCFLNKSGSLSFISIQLYLTKWKTYLCHLYFKDKIKYISKNCRLRYVDNEYWKTSGK